MQDDTIGELVGEASAIDALATGAISPHDVAALAQEARHDAVQRDAAKVQPRRALLARDGAALSCQACRAGATWSHRGGAGPELAKRGAAQERRRSVQTRRRCQ